MADDDDSRMRSFFGSIKEDITKAVQSASTSLIFTELPEVRSLELLDRVSIKLDSTAVSDDLENRISAGHHPQSFEDITILIRNEDNHKQNIMLAKLSPSKGIVLTSPSTRDVMIIKTPNNSINNLGKILHPSHSTMYKIVKEGQFSPNWWITKTRNNEAFIKIEKVLVSMYPIGKLLGLLHTDCVYWFKKPNGSILGYVRPKLSKKHATLIVKFMKHERDGQVRAAMLGASLLLFITEGYPHLREALIDSNDYHQQ
uniref:PK_Tyr_Ser-Thr domain-containing protein n=1 Tax=Rhabditophanes sp. KR3021 TaxID=114890 RepID=A0AC35UEZ4_9BILA